MRAGLDIFEAVERLGPNKDWGRFVEWLRQSRVDALEDVLTVPDEQLANARQRLVVLESVLEVIDTAADMLRDARAVQYGESHNAAP